MTALREVGSGIQQKEHPPIGLPMDRVAVQRAFTTALVEGRRALASDAAKMTPGLQEASGQPGRVARVTARVGSGGEFSMVLDSGLQASNVVVKPVPNDLDSEQTHPFWAAVTLNNTPPDEKKSNVTAHDDEKKPTLTLLAQGHRGGVVEVDAELRALNGPALDGKARQARVTAREHGAHKETSPEAASIAERSRAAHGDLVDARTKGLGVFQATLAVGASTEQGAQAAAAEFVKAAGGVDNLSLKVVGVRTSREAAHQLALDVALEREETKLVYAYATPERLGELFRMPERKTDQVLGLTVQDRPIFSENVPVAQSGTPALDWGHVVRYMGTDEFGEGVYEKVQPLTVPVTSLKEGHLLMVGGTRAAKSETLDHMIAQAAKQTNDAIVAFDFRKEDDHPGPISDRLEKYGIDREVIRLPLGGEGGLYFSLGLMDPIPGYDIKKHEGLVRDVIVSGFERKAGDGSTLADSTEGRIMDTVVARAILGHPDYPDERRLYAHGTPDLSDLFDRMGIIVAKDPAVAGEHTRSVQEFVTRNGEYNEIGDLGDLLGSGGQVIDYVEIVRSGKIVIPEFGGNLSDDDKKLLARVFIAKLNEAATVIGRRAMVAGDEAGGIFTGPSGKRLAERIQTDRNQSRGKVGEKEVGITYLFTLQNIDEVPTTVLQSTAVTVAGRSDDAKNREEIGKRMGLDESQKNFMTHLDPGVMVLKRPTMPDAALVRFPAPPPPGRRREAPAPDLAQIIEHGEAFEGPVTKEIRRQAEEFLGRTVGGKLLQWLIRDGIVAQVTGEGVVTPGETASTLGRAIGTLVRKHGWEVADDAVNLAVTKAVRKARGSLDGIDADKLTKYLADQYRGIVVGEGPGVGEDLQQPVRLDLVHGSFRQVPLARALDQHMDRPALSVPESLAPIVQRDRDTVNAQLAYVKYLIDGEFWKKYEGTRDELRKYQKGAPALNEEATQALCGEKIEGATVGDQLTTLEKIRATIGNDATVLGPTVSIQGEGEQQSVVVEVKTAVLQAFREKLLQQQAEARRTTEPLPQAQVIRLFGEEVPGDTADEQLQNSQKRAAKLARRSTQVSREKVVQMLNNVVWGFSAGSTGIEDLVAEAFREQSGFPDTDPATRSLDAAFAAGMDRKWIAMLGVFNKEFGMTPGARALIESAITERFNQTYDKHMRSVPNTRDSATAGLSEALGASHGREAKLVEALTQMAQAALELAAQRPPAPVTKRRGGN